MKNRDYYLNLPYQMTIQRMPRDDYFDGEFVAFYKEYPLITGAGDSEAEAIRELKEAFACFVDDALAHGDTIREPAWLEKKERINITVSQSILRDIKKVSSNRSEFFSKCARYALDNGINLGVAK